MVSLVIYPHEKKTVMVRIRFVRLGFACMLSLPLAVSALFILMRDNPAPVENIWLRGTLWFVVCIPPILFAVMMVLWIFEKPQPITLKVPHKRDPHNIY